MRTIFIMVCLSLLLVGCGDKENRNKAKQASKSTPYAEEFEGLLWGHYREHVALIAAKYSLDENQVKMILEDYGFCLWDFSTEESTTDEMNRYVQRFFETGRETRVKVEKISVKYHLPPNTVASILLEYKLWDDIQNIEVRTKD